MKPTYELIGACLMTFLASVRTCTTNPRLPLCNKRLVLDIHEFWRGAGTPQDIIGQIANSSGLVSLLSTKNYLAPEGGLTFLNASVDATYLGFSSGNDSENVYAVYYYQGAELDGVVSTLDQITKIYSIFIGNNVYIFYICNNEQGRAGPPYGIVFGDSSSLNDTATQITTTFAYGLLDVMGFKIVNDYRTEAQSL